jgi:hypothetical protein
MEQIVKRMQSNEWFKEKKMGRGRCKTREEQNTLSDKLNDIQ